MFAQSKSWNGIRGTEEIQDREKLALAYSCLVLEDNEYLARVWAAMRCGLTMSAYWALIRACLEAVYILAWVLMVDRDGLKCVTVVELMNPLL